ncbi:MAG: LLM class F420-dependent oxidoreductase [Actinomycetota bacterium]|nr:LLM class F420-dependent oxidoreductase [Actinomycetota bacterium]
MKIGAVYPQIKLGGDPDAVRRFGLAVEELGFDHLLVYDHVLGAVHADRTPELVGPYTERDPFHDPLMMFSYLAGITERIELVTGILILPQRQTALVARQTADLDLLSAGRFRLGVGVGWSHVEYEALGQDFTTRGAREEEQIELLRQLWTGDVVDFDGRFDRVDRAALVPKPTGQIPIWLGGWGSKALARAARIGDGFIFGGGTKDVLGMWERLRGLVGEAGRPVDEFGAEWIIPAVKGPDDVASKAETWAGAGGSHAAVVTMNMGLQGVDAHIDVLAKAASALGR